jgi:Fe-S-cluster containining protein
LLYGGNGLLEFQVARQGAPAFIAMIHPCLRCGACCAHFRVGLHWSEADPDLGGVVPVELTEKLDAHRLAMRGTWAERPHCIALEGKLGESARCGIYERRPSVCREVEPSWESGVPSTQCDKARVARGLRPLTPQDWLDFAAATA